MVSILTWLIGAGAVKAHAGGLMTGLVATFGPVFLEGFSGEAVEGVRTLGQIAGQFVVTYAIGYVGTWLAPRNRV